MEQRRERKRTLALVLAFISVAALGVGTFTNRWLMNVEYGDSFGIGLRDVEICPRECVTASNFELIDQIEAEIDKIVAENAKLPANQQRVVPRRPWHGFPVVGLIAFYAAVVAAAGLIVGASICLARKRPVLPIMPTTFTVLGLAVGIVNGCIFVATKPPSLELVAVGWSFIVFGAGAVTGLAAVFPLNRQIRPIDVELGAAAATMSWGGSRDDMP